MLDANKMIRAGVRVKVKFGPLVPNLHTKPGKTTRRICSEGKVIVLCALNAKRWLIKRDQDGKAVEARTCILTIIEAAIGVLVDEFCNNVSKINMIN